MVTSMQDNQLSKQMKGCTSYMTLFTYMICGLSGDADLSAYVIIKSILLCRDYTVTIQKKSYNIPTDCLDEDGYLMLM